MIIFALTSSYGVEDARYIDEQVKLLLLKSRSANSLSDGWDYSWQRLEEIRNDCSSPGWNGEDAEPASLTSYNSARRFLDCMPLGIETPNPGIDPYGYITLEWRRPDGRLLSLTFDDSGFVHYVVFLKFERLYGRKPISLGYQGQLKNHLEAVLPE